MGAAVRKWWKESFTLGKNEVSEVWRYYYSQLSKKDNGSEYCAKRRICCEQTNRIIRRMAAGRLACGYAPFNRLGRGNTGYLFEANKEMYQYIIQQTAMAQNNVLDKQRVMELLTPGENSKKTELEVEMDIEEIAAKQMSPEKLARQVADSKPKGAQKTESVVYYRSPYIKEMVKQIADGKCQMCGEDAPFYDAGKKPYLEGHHVKRLADGGKDAMDNVVAICPNCHRKIHVLNDEVDTIVLEGIAEQNKKQYERLLAYAKKFMK